MVYRYFKGTLKISRYDEKKQSAPALNFRVNPTMFFLEEMNSQTQECEQNKFYCTTNNYFLLKLILYLPSQKKKQKTLMPLIF